MVPTSRVNLFHGLFDIGCTVEFYSPGLYCITELLRARESGQWRGASERLHPMCAHGAHRTVQMTTHLRMRGRARRRAARRVTAGHGRRGRARWGDRCDGMQSRVAVQVSIRSSEPCLALRCVAFALPCLVQSCTRSYFRSNFPGVHAQSQAQPAGAKQRPLFVSPRSSDVACGAVRRLVAHLEQQIWHADH